MALLHSIHDGPNHHHTCTRLLSSYSSLAAVQRYFGDSLALDDPDLVVLHDRLDGLCAEQDAVAAHLLAVGVVVAG